MKSRTLYVFTFEYESHCGIQVDGDEWRKRHHKQRGNDKQIAQITDI